MPEIILVNRSTCRHSTHWNPICTSLCGPSLSRPKFPLYIHSRHAFKLPPHFLSQTFSYDGPRADRKGLRNCLLHQRMCTRVQTVHQPPIIGEGGIKVNAVARNYFQRHLGQHQESFEKCVLRTVISVEAVVSSLSSARNPIRCYFQHPRNAGIYALLTTIRAESGVPVCVPERRQCQPKITRIFT